MEKIASLLVEDETREREIALYLGDITELGTETPPVDILVASAFPDDYVPTATSLIGALVRAGLPVSSLAANKEWDLRATSGFWLSKEIGNDGGWAGARRLAVFEPQALGTPPEAVGAMFRGLFPFLSNDDQTVAMPVLGAGNQGWPAVVMMDAMLDAAVEWMRRGLPVSELMIIERNEPRARELAAHMNARRSSPSRAITTATHTSPNDVFLSFSSRDTDAANAFKSELQAARPGTTVFDFRLSIDKGASYQTEIDRAIESCTIVVAVLSPAYFASPECQEELNIARLRNKRKIYGPGGEPVLIPAYWKSVTPQLPLWTQTLNYVNCVEAESTKMVDLATTIDTALTAHAVEASMP